MNETSERARDLAAFANAGAQPNQPQGSASAPPPGHALVRPTSGIAERVIGAQPVAVHRDEQKIFQKLAALAAAAGSDWFYRFPVKNRQTGQTDWIEGPSIKLANDVARIFGNNVNEVREIDVGDAWIFYARFTDIETGFSMERAYRQRKSQTSMRTRDSERQLDIAYQIGQSKAIRNAIVNALQIYADYAFEEARNSLVEKIGKDLDGWRKRTIDRLAKMPIELARVERVIGRAAKDWLAPNVAQVVAMAKSIADGMASVDEVFPPIEEKSESAPEGGRQDGARNTESESAARMSESATADRDNNERDRPATIPADESKVEEDAIARAYERGKEAKSAGHQRKAMPPEYRGEDHSAEAEAWGRGYDGREL